MGSGRSKTSRKRDELSQEGENGIVWKMCEEAFFFYQKGYEKQLSFWNRVLLFW